MTSIDNKHLKKILVLVLCGFFYIKTTYAIPETAIINFFSGPGVPITTINANIQDKGSSSFSQRTEYYQLHPLSDDSLLSNLNLESQKQYLYNFFITTYGLTNNLMLGTGMSYLNTYQTKAAIPIDEANNLGVKKLGNISGYADQTFFGIWQLSDKTKNNKKLQTSILFGFSAPTGKTNVKMNTGDIFSASDQPGSGSWSPFAGIIFSRNFNRFSFSNNLIYTQATKGSQDTILSNYLNYFFAGTYELIEEKSIKGVSYSIDGILELLGEYASNNKVAGIIDPNTGYNTISLSPGIRINFAKTTSCYININLPMAEFNYGTQASSNFNIFAGVDFNF